MKIILAFMIFRSLINQNRQHPDIPLIHFIQNQNNHLTVIIFDSIKFNYLCYYLLLLLVISNTLTNFLLLISNHNLE